jgi:regulator of RNase E activity RraA
MTLTKPILDALRATSTGTIHTILLKKGIRRTWMQGPRPMFHAGERVVGPAFTLRFVPAREDLATPESWSSPTSTRGAIEDMPEGAIAIADAMGVTGAGIFGDILCARMKKRGVTALITDGVMRDGVGVESTGLPVWCSGVAAPASVAGLTFVGWNQPIGCGGVAVFPNDIIVADQDGAVVIPAALVEDVAAAGPEQELLEMWIMKEVDRGVPLPGLYPPNAETRARYEAERSRS